MDQGESVAGEFAVWAPTTTTEEVCCHCWRGAVDCSKLPPLSGLDLSSSNGLQRLGCENNASNDDDEEEESCRCTEGYCSQACLEAARPWHATLCCAGKTPGEALHEFWSTACPTSKAAARIIAQGGLTIEEQEVVGDKKERRRLRRRAEELDEAAALIGSRDFTRLVLAMERYQLPLPDVPSPLLLYTARLAESSVPLGELRIALPAVVALLRRRRRPSDERPDDERAELTRHLFEMSMVGDDETSLRRRAVLASQCAEWLLGGTSMACFSPSLKIPHSCVPSRELRFDAGLRLVELTAAAPSVAWPKKEDCGCELCLFERSGTMPEELLAVGKSLIDQGRFEEALPLIRAAITAGSTAEAWLALALTLLNLDRWNAAHNAWARAFELHPENPLLRKQHAKQQVYAKCLAKEQVTSCDADVDRRVFSDDRVLVVTKAPLVTPKECAMLISLAEEHVAVDGWTTARHHAYPTTDFPVHESRPIAEWFCPFFQQKVAPLLRRHFPGLGECSIGVHDAFLVKYTGGGQASLPFHTDESKLSLILPLNSDFQGGGTYFADLGRAVGGVEEVGHLVAFDGRLLHAGQPIISGTRYIIAAFLYLAPPPNPRDDDPLEESTKKRLREDEPGAPAAPFSFNFQM